MTCYTKILLTNAFCRLCTRWIIKDLGHVSSGIKDMLIDTALRQNNFISKVLEDAGFVLRGHVTSCSRQRTQRQTGDMFRMPHRMAVIVYNLAAGQNHQSRNSDSLTLTNDTFD